MPEELDHPWLAVIGKSWAYLCLTQAEKADPQKMSGIVPKVNFLKGLGLSQAQAAEAVGSSAASVAELIRQAKARKGAKTSAKKVRR